MQPDELDQLFRGGLEGHRTPPPRALWERLDDELHPPRRRRRAAWWPLALAAVVALLLVAGGAGLWGGGGRPAPGHGPALATTRPKAAGAASTPKLKKDAGPTPDPATVSTASRPGSPAVVGPAAAARESNARNAAIARNTPAQPRPSPVPGRGAGRQPKRLTASAPAALIAAAPAARKVARAGQPAAAQSVVAAKTFSSPPPPTQATRPDMAASTLPGSSRLARQAAAPPTVPAPGSLSFAAGPAPQPAPAAGRAVSLPVAPTPLHLANVIEVEVRPGGGPIGVAEAGTPAAAASPAEADQAARRRRPGGLGQQLGQVLGGAGRVVRTARQGLNALQELPGSLTVQARVGERTVSKTLNL